MLAATVEATGQDPEGLAELIGKSEHTRLLTATAMVGAASTAWPPKVYALGRALADGLIADGDQINIAPPPSWSPTELGERALEYYHLAAGDLGVPQASASGGG